MAQQEIKVNKKSERLADHPFYDSFTFQLSAIIKTARQIKKDMQGETPNKINKLLDEFDMNKA